MVAGNAAKLVRILRNTRLINVNLLFRESGNLLDEVRQ
jgi:hypothetical protein